MNKPLIIILFFSGFTYSQNIQQCKYRFDTYLNYKNSLNAWVKFDEKKIQLMNNSGHTELTIYEEEINTLAFFFENSTVEEQEILMKKKGIKRFNKRQLDSIYIFADDWKSVSNHLSNKPLQGYRIAIDPGHFSTTLQESETEQKFLYFVKDSILYPNDTIKLFESALNFNTAQLLKKMLEEDGAEVLLSREQENFTSFNCTYTHWIKAHKRRMLDSLTLNDKISKEQKNQILRYNEKKFFWDFFRDFDLTNRANKINNFHPHLSVIIHYNVDEKNEPWKQFTKNNFTMTFIGGVFAADAFAKRDMKYNFLRLLLSDQLNRSQKLAEEAVYNFKEYLSISIANQEDAAYLKESCKVTPSAGVFSRNLMLCRKVNSPLVYGESLYQDNQAEAEELMKLDQEFEGIKTNQRLMLVAKAYYDALRGFVKKENE